VTPLAPERYALQFTIGQNVHDKLRYAQELMSHQLPSGEIAEIFERALDALIPQLEKRKFAATDRPRKSATCSRAGSRHIPAQVRRAVWQRDGGQCTFVSATGQRCPARRFLEFDHMDEVARDGVATVSRVRLRCRAHNQYEAERTFGAEFMANKRRAAAEAQAAVKAQVEAAARAQAAAAEVIPWLRRLGFRADEARQAAAFCETIPDAPLEERVRRALSFFHAKPAHPTPSLVHLATVG
jgi:5-methylcytosine-specific restriction endonuclease McrA